MSDYYAEAAGNDTTGDGSLGNPWKTIDKLFNQAVSVGDTYNVKYGEAYYTGAGGIAKELAKLGQHGENGNPIIVRPYGDPNDGLPRLKCFDHFPNAWVDTLVTAGGNTVWENDIDGGLAVEANSYMWVDNVLQTRLTWDTNVATTFDDPANQEDYFAVNTATNKVYTCQPTDPNSDGLDYDLIVNNNLRDYFFRAFDLDYWKFENLIIEGGWLAPIYLTGLTASRSNVGHEYNQCILGKGVLSNLRVWPTNTTINFEVVATNCLLRDGNALVGSSSIQVVGAETGFGHKIEFDGLRFVDCSHGIQLNDTTNGLSRCHGHIRTCEIAEEIDDGIWFGRGNILPDGEELLIEGNVIHNRGDGGITFTGFAANGVFNTHVRNNTIALTGQAGALAYNLGKNCSFEGNIIYLPNRQNEASQRVSDSDLEIMLNNGSNIRNNVVYTDNNNVNGINVFTVRNLTGGIQTNYNDPVPLSYENMKSDVLPHESHSVFADPEFERATPTRAKHCRLQKTSPALKQGPPTHITTDFYGKSISRPFVGAIASKFATPNVELEVRERVSDKFIEIEIEYDIAGASLTETVDVKNCCGIIHSIEHIPVFVDAVDVGWNLVLNDEYGVDILRGLGSIGNNRRTVFIDEASTNLKYGVCTSTLQFVATLAGEGGRGSIILSLV